MEGAALASKNILSAWDVPFSSLGAEPVGFFVTLSGILKSQFSKFAGESVACLMAASPQLKGSACTLRRARVEFSWGRKSVSPQIPYFWKQAVVNSHLPSRLKSVICQCFCVALFLGREYPWRGRWLQVCSDAASPGTCLSHWCEPIPLA